MLDARPTPDEIFHQLGERIAGALRAPLGELRLEPIDGVIPRDDAPAVLRVVDGSQRPRAVVLCSAPRFPDMVERAMSRAAQAKPCLAAPEAAAILDPLLEGRLHELSYAMVRYCRPLSDRRPLWWLQRSLLRPRILEWLYRVTAATVSEATPSQKEARFAEPLACLGSLNLLSASVRGAVLQAERRLHEGAWRPMHVLMHGDLWKGNILIDLDTARDDRKRWRDRFVIIDWPGSERHGYAMYDLVRLARSMKMGDAALQAEVLRHCTALGGDTQDAMGYLLSALGAIALHLEQFPMEQFLPMVEACHSHLRRAHAH